MQLYFEDRYGRLRPVAKVETLKDANLEIADFLDKYNYKSHYTRMWISEGEEKVYVTFDVGSHSEFFKVEFDSYIAAKGFIEAGLNK